MRDRTEWCACVNGYPIHKVIANDGESLTIECSKCGKTSRVATEAHLRYMRESAK